MAMEAYFVKTAFPIGLEAATELLCAQIFTRDVRQLSCCAG